MLSRKFTHNGYYELLRFIFNQNRFLKRKNISYDIRSTIIEMC